MLFFFTSNMAAVTLGASNWGGAASSTLYSLMSSISIFSSLAVEQKGILYAHASIRSAEVKIGPFSSDTSPKRVDRGGLGKCRTGTRQGTPHYQLYLRSIWIPISPLRHLAIVLYLLPSNKGLFGLKSFHSYSATRFWLVQSAPWNMFFNHSTADAYVLYLEHFITFFLSELHFFFIVAHCSSLAYFRP